VKPCKICFKKGIFTITAKLGQKKRLTYLDSFKSDVSWAEEEVMRSKYWTTFTLFLFETIRNWKLKTVITKLRVPLNRDDKKVMVV